MIAVRNIPGFPKYRASRCGRIFSPARRDSLGRSISGRWLNPIRKSGGHLSVDLCINGQHHPRQIHRLVLETYVGPCPDGMECRHLDGNPKNNNLDNLRWGTRSENSQDSIRHGTHAGSKTKGEKCNLSKLKDWQVRLIFNAYHDGAYTQKELAQIFEVDKTTIHYIVVRKTWRHINGKS